MPVRLEPQGGAGVEGHAGLGQSLGGGLEGEFRVGGEEGVHDGLVLLTQQAAGGVHEAPARLHQPGGGGEDGRLLGGELRHGVRRLAEFQVRVAAQGAQAATGGVHQHPVGLAREALHLHVVLPRDEQGVDVGEARTGEARLQLGEALLRHVEGVEPPLGVHEGAQEEGLAPRPGAEIHHHIAAARGEEQAQELAALVLHLHLAREEERVALQGDLAGEADAEGGIGRGGGFDALRAEGGKHLVAVGQQGVHAQVQGRGLLEDAAQDQGLRFPVLGGEALPQPVGQVRLLGGGEGGLRSLGGLEPFVLVVLELGFQLADAAPHQACQGEQDELARAGAGGDAVEEALAAQDGVHRLGHELPVPRAHLGMFAEIAGQHAVRRILEAQHRPQGVDGMGEGGGLRLGGVGFLGFRHGFQSCMSRDVITCSAATSPPFSIWRIFTGR